MARLTTTYGLLAAGLLALEIFIARYVHDGLVRPYAGDLLATIFVYCLLRSWWRAPAGVAAGVALLISYAVEAAQALHGLAWLGWHARAARLLLGSRFEWSDMLAYTLGAALVVALELLRGRRPPGDAGGGFAKKIFLPIFLAKVLTAPHLCPTNPPLSPPGHV